MMQRVFYMSKAILHTGSKTTTGGLISEEQPVFDEAITVIPVRVVAV